MAPLILIGYWRSERDPEWPDPATFVDPAWDDDVRFQVLSYLRHAQIAHACMGYSPCRMCDLSKNGNLELTDGTYLWPEGLAHYVETHDVRLPTQFVKHCLRTEEYLFDREVDRRWWAASQPDW